MSMTLNSSLEGRSGNLVTKAEATALGLRWKQRGYQIPCAHLTLDSESNEEGDATGKYICILCGGFFHAQGIQPVE